ncbi:hypothetical protein [Xanthobacter sp. VNH20]|uniref:hypothetical protein n=1 Tax=Xanthobacter sp. VNH20 TaxID=3156616 RepID=UPI0032B4742F
MPAIGFPVQSAPGPTPQESAGRLLNAYAGTTPEGSGSVNIIRRVPGLISFCDTGQSVPRGLLRAGNYVFAAYKNAVMRIDQGGVASYVGVLPGSGPVYMALNNRTPIPDIVAVSEDGAYVITSSSVSELAESSLPQPNSVCMIDGYFFFSIADGRMFATGLNDTDINALTVARAEARQGGLTRVIPYNGQLFACKPTSIEVWNNTAEPSPGFPFSRAAVIDQGLLAPRAVAGVQEGFATALIMVTDDGAVSSLNGYQMVKISTADVDRAISSVADKSTLRAVAYTCDGTPFWALTAPDWTWEYNLELRRWHERESHGLGRWRIGSTVYAGQKWLGADTTSGRILEISSAADDEAGEPLEWLVESIQMGSFPKSYRVGRTEFDFVVGVGRDAGADPIETDPTLRASWSDDGGVIWKTPVVVPLGREGDGRRRVRMPGQLGRTGAKGRRWRLQVSDPVHVALLGGDMDVRAGK